MKRSCSIQVITPDQKAGGQHGIVIDLKIEGKQVKTEELLCPLPPGGNPSPIRLKTYTGEYGKPSVSKIISDVNSRCTSKLECTSKKSEKSGQSI